MTTFSHKVILTITLSLFCGLGLPSVTLAWFFDTEESAETQVTAGILDFRLTKTSFDAFIGQENSGEKEITTVAIPEDGSLDMQYIVTAASTTPSICDDFDVTVKQNEDIVYSGQISEFTAATTTDFGTWNFEFDIPSGASVAHGDICQSDFVFHAWRDDVTDPSDSGFYAIKTLSTTLRAKTVVLNEVLADPDTTAVSPANVEFIELKNNGAAPVDIAGWEIGEISGSSEDRHVIVGSGASASQMNTVSGDTVVQPGGYAVLVFGGTASYLNNGGDTINLYDTPATNSEIDSYRYLSSIGGKSDARYPDGLGAWVDPIPTPGEQNTLTEYYPLLLKNEIDEQSKKDDSETLIVNEEKNTEELDEEIRDDQLSDGDDVQDTDTQDGDTTDDAEEVINEVSSVDEDSTSGSEDVEEKDEAKNEGDLVTQDDEVNEDTAVTEEVLSIEEKSAEDLDNTDQNQEDELENIEDSEPVITEEKQLEEDPISPDGEEEVIAHDDLADDEQENEAELEMEDIGAETTDDAAEPPQTI